MSRERTLASLKSDIKSRKRKGKPLADLVAEIQRGPDSRGVVEPIYRHDAACRRHLLIDTTLPALKREYNRVARRVAKRAIAQAA